jgi:hypothetical protein
MYSDRGVPLTEFEVESPEEEASKDDESRKLARRFSTLPVEGAIGLYSLIIGGGVPLFSREREVVAS